MRDVAAETIADFRGEMPQIIVLIQIATGKVSTPYLRYTSREHPVIWGGETFSPRPFELDDTTLDAHTETSGPRLRIMDLDSLFGDLVAEGYDFTYKRVRVVRTNEGSTEGTGTRGLIDDWFIDFYERAGGAFSFTLKPMVSSFSQPIPLRRISRLLFPGIPDPD